MSRVLLGGLAGVAATVAMTATMRRLHNVLNIDKQYPLPPRLIMDRVSWSRNEHATKNLTIFAHVGYGALTGALFALLPRQTSGTRFGLAVWAASYLGWLPAFGLLSPAVNHPAQRNLLMMAAHVVWGSTLAGSLSELEGSRHDVFGRSRSLAHRDEPKMVTNSALKV
ncbi:DUF1440 domain-containing protein [Brucella sp. 21LCYQ03]|nr:DUF1440 domain-containing protein [Brucella sp. 21LCYQ03]